VLDGTRGYLSSFLEEAFGGLVRRHGFKPSDLSQVLEIKAKDPFFDTYRVLAHRYIANAKPETAAAS
jgi:hypothetical protein